MSNEGKERSVKAQTKKIKKNSNNLKNERFCEFESNF